MANFLFGLIIGSMTSKGKSSGSGIKSVNPPKPPLPPKPVK